MYIHAYLPLYNIGCGMSTVFWSGSRLDALPRRWKGLQLSDGVQCDCVLHQSNLLRAEPLHLAKTKTGAKGMPYTHKQAI